MPCLARKIQLIENEGLNCQRESIKKRGPQNEGISKDVYENKGRKNRHSESL
jgi:hypothetical protein